MGYRECVLRSIEGLNFLLSQSHVCLLSSFLFNSEFILTLTHSMSWGTWGLATAQAEPVRGKLKHQHVYKIVQLLGYYIHAKIITRVVNYFPSLKFVEV